MVDQCVGRIGRQVTLLLSCRHGVVKNDVNFQDGGRQLQCVSKGVLPFKLMKINKEIKLERYARKRNYLACSVCIEKKFPGLLAGIRRLFVMPENDPGEIQLTLIFTSLISINCLSRSENLVLA